MKITQQQIIDALKENPEFVTGILPEIEKTEAFTVMFSNKTKVDQQKAIDAAIRESHERYDEQLKKAGLTPKPKADGKLEKTYEVLDRFVAQHNELKSKVDSFDENERIKELKRQNEELKKNSDGPYKSLYEQTIKKAQEKELELTNRIADIENSTSDFKKKIAINKATSNLKFNPDVSESIRKMVLSNVEQKLLSTSKFEKDKFVFVDADDKVILNSKYEPISVEEMLGTLDEVKEITLDNSASKGGGADVVITGSIETKSVEGKDTKRLNLDSANFKTQTEFFEFAEKKMQESGITSDSEDWQGLKTKAYQEYQIDKLPS